MGKIPWTLVCSADSKYGPGSGEIEVFQALCSSDIPEGTTHALVVEPGHKSRFQEITWVVDPDNKLIAPSGTKLSILVALRGEHAKNMRILGGVEVYSA